MKIDVTDVQLETVRHLLECHLPGAVAWAYGSRVKGTSRRNSDLDLVLFVDQASRAKVDDLQESFDESDLPFSVDLHVWNELPREWQEQIAGHKIELSRLTNQPN